ncbi:uncharacterized protein LTR77_010206 [Saxophila tyrrhenica]|uniref:Uncharacterized protein n=1 Tax=Saxophila tyrrhenica TaxID=1690608 RepID=A0AAV9NYT4_9PEZI|nr:hypothetical protein LTR77_010206 [Saxophila tyrrhenica]
MTEWPALLLEIKDFDAGVSLADMLTSNAILSACRWISLRRLGGISVTLCGYNSTWINWWSAKSTLVNERFEWIDGDPGHSV